MKGQISVLWNREDIDRMIDNESVDQDIKNKLILVQDVRKFAATELDLPVGDAYSQYSDTGRRYVVWNLFAAPELSVEPYKWCFPVAGCVSYRGYFSKADAEAKAAEMKEQGYDVHVGGIAAYSTLGWFDDPVLNTFVKRRDDRLAALLIHEISHRQIYIKGDTTFNESFATTVETIGLKQWLASQEGAVEGHFEKYQKEKQQFSTLISLVLDYREKFTALFNKENLTDEEKRNRKISLYEEMNNRYQVLKQENAWDDRFDQWMTTMNNAKIATIGDYQGLVPGFTQLFISSGRDWKAFYNNVEQLSKLSKEERNKKLKASMFLAP